MCVLCEIYAFYVKSRVLGLAIALQGQFLSPQNDTLLKSRVSGRVVALQGRLFSPPNGPLLKSRVLMCVMCSFGRDHVLIVCYTFMCVCSFVHADFCFLHLMFVLCGCVFSRIVLLVCCVVFICMLICVVHIGCVCVCF